MKNINIKKLLILNVPYLLMGLFATNLGEAWRLAEGADMSAKLLSFFFYHNDSTGQSFSKFSLDGSDGRYHLWRRTSPCSLSEREKCKKISTQ